MSYPTIAGGILLVLFGAFELVMRQGPVAKSWSAGDEDAGSTRLMLLIWAPAIAALFTAGHGPRLPLWTQWVGIAMGSAGVILRRVAFRTLGAYYTRTLVTVAGQRVVRRGPYRYIRHPGYLSALLIWVGAAAGFGFLLPPLLELLLLIPVYTYRIGVEERMLLKNLGSEYATYREKSWRLVPFVF
ncbi:MAG TPA: isoprenylcysteine carboxylmethyltransferase family protein [Deltaproteobacteria bacterium]|jgi:protein-S-isoprenylcysteine O-methyltransferase Ste14|nr:isoprenylcysteine carboxylmethyltransferase family protein [Deltaproteobacteria bacterium]